MRGAAPCAPVPCEAQHGCDRPIPRAREPQHSGTGTQWKPWPQQHQQARGGPRRGVAHLEAGARAARAHCTEVGVILGPTSLCNLTATSSAGTARGSSRSTTPRRNKRRRYWNTKTPTSYLGGRLRRLREPSTCRGSSGSRTGRPSVRSRPGSTIGDAHRT